MKQTSTEILVGLFILAGFLAFCYLAFNLGEVSLFGNSRMMTIKAEFDNISGVKKGSSVQIAGVPVGAVTRVALVGPHHLAEVAMELDKTLKIPADSVASVKSQGIIGDKYIKITLGGDSKLLTEGGELTETESAVDIESLISKFAFGGVQKEK
ncbi:MAG: outer membrane lipid asymmetry maintenance protein MlaD [Desulfobulbaceae bacterium]|jgi:phospholipid/cholesterol/gamma-HCH transport system substrate-binding protein|nr:outer membrane lipid asymmetry maintenance protein MlaD [Desulfobulbaceae bacterium]